MADKHMQRCSISSASSEMQIKTTMSYYFIATGMAILKKDRLGTSLAVQWLRLHTPNVGGPGSIPVQGTRSHVHAATKSPHATTKSLHPMMKILRATTKTWCSQKYK